LAGGFAIGVDAIPSVRYDVVVVVVVVVEVVVGADTAVDIQSDNAIVEP
jgi:hypothetical protein